MKYKQDKLGRWNTLKYTLQEKLDTTMWRCYSPITNDRIRKDLRFQLATSMGSVEDIAYDLFINSTV